MLRRRSLSYVFSIAETPDELSVLSYATMREFFETQEEWVTREFVEENGEEALDAPFDIASVSGYGDGYFPPNPRPWMISESAGDPDLDGLLDGLVAVFDNIGSNAVMVIEDKRSMTRFTLVSSPPGYDVVGWEALGLALI